MIDVATSRWHASLAPVIVAGIATATLACDSTPPEPPNTPPKVRLTIADQELYVEQEFAVPDLDQYFDDADGDTLQFEAMSGHETLVSVSVSGTKLTGSVSRERGIGTVTVTATDPPGASATQEFTVTVLNRAPSGDWLPDMRIATESSDSVVVGQYFEDPDQDDLTYTATSDNEDVVRVSVLEDVLAVIAGSRVGYTSVRVTAMDAYGGNATVVFSVTVLEANSGFREDFDTTGSLASWRPLGLRARVVDSMLVLDSLADGFEWIPHLLRAVDISEGWTVTFSVAANNDNDLVFSQVLAFTGEDTGEEPLRLWRLTYNWAAEMWSVDILRGEIFFEVAEGAFALETDEQSLIEWALSADHVMTLTIKGTEVYKQVLTGEMPGGLDPPIGMTDIGVGFFGYRVPENGVTHDFVEIAPGTEG